MNIDAMPPLDLSSTLDLHEDVRYRTIDGEAVVVRLTTNDVLVLNEVAARVLDLAANGKSIEEVIDIVLGEFEVARDRLEGDVLDLARQLVEDEILVISGGQSSGGEPC